MGMPPVFAAADLGSNTVHLLVAEVTPGGLRRLRNESEWLSLGETVSRTGSVPESLERRLAATLRRYKQMAATEHASQFYVFATEAIRAAENGTDVLERIRKTVGVSVDVISPRREAELSVRGLALDSAGPEPFVMIEVGGGSAQVALCEGGEVTEEVSLPLGTGRLIAASGLTQPARPEQIDRLRQVIDESVGRLYERRGAVRAVACGGVARGLWRSLHPDGDRTLRRFEIDYLAQACATLDVEHTMLRFGVKRNRAATLLPGALVYGRLLTEFGLESMLVSQNGVREGAVLELSRLIPTPIPA